MFRKVIGTAVLWFFFLSPITAEIMECATFDPEPGKKMQLVTMLKEVSVWHKERGATPGIYPFNSGGQGEQVDYCLRWDDGVAWAKYKDMVGKEWAKKPAKKPDDSSFPAKTISVKTFQNLDLSVKANSFNGPHIWHVFSVFPSEGRESDVVERLQRMKELVESGGNRAEIYQDGPGGNGSYYFLTINDSWISFTESYEKSGATPEAAMFQQDADPSMYAGGSTEANGFSLEL